MEVPLICWWCVHALPQHPCLHLPIRYDDKRDTFMTIGNFCSWQCAKAYAIDMGTSRAGEIQSLLFMMRRRSIGKYEPLWPAPKREALACFGGTLTIEQFRSFGGLVEPPIVHYPFEKRYIPIIGGNEAPSSRPAKPASQSDNPNARLKAIENSVTSGDSLKLKRSKPLARSASKLESALGITRKTK